VTDQVPLREHVDAILKQMDLRYQQRFEAQERAIDENQTTNNDRLKGMNEFRGTVQDVIGKCITRSEAVTMILAACAVSSALVGIVGFFVTMFLRR